MTAIAVTGLRTFLGKRLVERLVGGGHDVLGLDLHRPHALDAGARFCEIDLTLASAGKRLADELEKHAAETLVHLAFKREPTPDIEADHELDVIGTLQVLNACAAIRVPRLVIASTTMAYGPRPDNPNFLDESQPLRGHPDAHAVQDRVEVESLVADWRVRHPDTEVTVLRPCWIIGPNALGPVVRFFARPVVPMLMGYDPLLQWIHERDCLDVFEKATLERHPGVFNVVAPEVVPLSTLIRSAGKRALPIPPPLLRRLGAIPSQTQTGDPPDGFTDYLRYLWVADGARGWEAFGRPYYTSREAWMSFVAASRLRAYR